MMACQAAICSGFKQTARFHFFKAMDSIASLINWPSKSFSFKMAATGLLYRREKIGAQDEKTSFRNPV